MRPRLARSTLPDTWPPWASPSRERNSNELNLERAPCGMSRGLRQFNLIMSVAAEHRAPGRARVREQFSDCPARKVTRWKRWRQLRQLASDPRRTLKFATNPVAGPGPVVCHPEPRGSSDGPRQGAVWSRGWSGLSVCSQPFRQIARLSANHQVLVRLSKVGNQVVVANMVSVSHDLLLALNSFGSSWKETCKSVSSRSLLTIDWNLILTFKLVIEAPAPSRNNCATYSGPQVIMHRSNDCSISMAPRRLLANELWQE